MNEEIRLKLYTGDCSGWAGGFFWSGKPRSNKQADRQGLCCDELFRLCHIPKNTKVIYAVFAKRDRKDAFCIGPNGIIEGYDGPFSLGTEIYLGKAYDVGYRYVHIEY